MLDCDALRDKNINRVFDDEDRRCGNCLFEGGSNSAYLCDHCTCRPDNAIYKGYYFTLSDYFEPSDRFLREWLKECED